MRIHALLAGQTENTAYHRGTANRPEFAKEAHVELITLYILTLK